ncbi:MAG: AMP-binding protein [Gammaproteobacteria bacterium]|nr:AMP-binding protein [Gammaproteobacteria bacterium]
MNIANLLAKAAQRAPDKTAVVFQGTSLTYAELERVADAVALSLGTRGINAGDRVGLLLPKSPLALAAIFGVLKLGATYVPLDIGSPVSRIESICRSADIRGVIGVPPTLTPLADSAELTRTVASWTLQELSESTPSTSAVTSIAADATAVIFFTSGSTGVPKGVMIGHPAIRCFVEWVVDAFKLTDRDVLVSHAPWQFDLSLLDIYAAVASGATLVLVPEPWAANGKQLTRLIRDSGVTVWQSVPSALTLMVHTDADAVLPGMREVLFAGERMPLKTLAGAYRQFPNAVFNNIYGCTETNDTFYYRLPTNFAEVAQPLPIGRPLPYVDYQIVDEYGEPVELDTPGRLLVSGPTQLQAYVGAVDAATDGAGYYDTKDIVREDADGLLHYLGRSDSIVKTSGYRVNLLEIEGALEANQRVAEAAVIAVADDMISSKLVAYVRTRDGEKLTTLDVKCHLAERLPKYAIPHEIKFVQEQLPKTVTGKTNRTLLAQSYS